MNVRNNVEKVEKMEKKGDAPDEKGEKKEGAMKKFGKYFVATTAIIATLGLAGCKAMDSTGRRPIDIDSTTDVSSDNALEGVEDMDEMDGESDVPEDGMDAVTDVPEDTEMDSEEDVVSDVEEDVSEDAESEDVSEDTVMDSSEDVVSEDVMEEDVESEDTIGDVSTDTSVDTSVDTITDVSVDDVAVEDLPTYCSASDQYAERRITRGVLFSIGGIEVIYEGIATSGNAEFSILCGGTIVRTGIEVAEGATHTEDLTTESFRVTFTPVDVEATYVRVQLTVDSY